MPELAEVEYYRKQWDCGLNQKVLATAFHSEKRIFRGLDVSDLKQRVTGATLLRSESRGKQMLFCFTRNVWLGLHLGMTGKLRSERPGLVPEKHDHLVLRQKRQSLVFSDPRLFGRVLFHCGREVPRWWASLPAGIMSAGFTSQKVAGILSRRKKGPIKAVLLSQKLFPGLGNWMVDEILWRSGIHPARKARELSNQEIKGLYRQIRFVSKTALNTVGKDDSDLPQGWFFHERWKSKGRCPSGHGVLKKETIGGRTTAWCRQCQPPSRTKSRRVGTKSSGIVDRR